jgi:hypothetical protein
MIPSDFSNNLLPGERLIWSGKPRQGLYFRATDLFLVPFSLLWGGFAIFWETSVIFSGAPFFFWLWGIPFVLAGIYIVAGRFVVDAWARRNTDYTLTDRRVLIVRARPFAKTTALNLGMLPDIGLSEGRNGRGTIQFGPASFFADGGWGAWMPAFDPTPRLVGIDDARAVFTRLQSLLPQAR